MSQASKQQEKTFTGKVGFVLASVGAAIGLGAIWKFPYMAGAEGGAAFLLPYIIFPLPWLSAFCSRKSPWAKPVKAESSRLTET